MARVHPDRAELLAWVVVICTGSEDPSTWSRTACGVTAPIPVEEALRLLEDTELLVLADCYGLAPPPAPTRADLVALLTAACAGRHSRGS